MNASFQRHAGTFGRPVVGQASGFSSASMQVQVLMLYLVTRDLLLTWTVLVFYVPLAGSIHVRAVVALLLAWVALGTRGLAHGFAGLGPWGWLVLGPFGFTLLVEGILTVVVEGDSKRIMIILIDSSIVLFAVGVAYLYAIRGAGPKSALRFIVQPYCYFAIFIAATGLVAWTLVHTGAVNPDDWAFTGYVPQRDVAAGAGYTYYTMPFYLSLVLNVSRGSFMGLEFSRASGLFQEPVLAAFFVAPAIFLLPLVMDQRSARWKFRAASAVLMLFLAVVHSATGFTLLGVIGALFFGRLLLRHPSRRGRLGAAAALVVLVFLLMAVVGTPGTIRTKWQDQGPGHIEGLMDVLDSSAFLGTGFYQTPRSVDLPWTERQLSILAMGSAIAQISFLAAIGLAMMLSRSQKWYLGGVLIYVAGHSVKAFGHITTSGFYLYILFVMALALACYWGKSPKRAPQEATVMRGPLQRQHAG